MLDPHLLRRELAATAAQLRRKGFVLDVAALAELQSRRKTLQVATEQLQARRKQLSREIGQARARGAELQDAELQPLLAQVAALAEQLDGTREELKQLQQTLRQQLLTIPNVPDKSVPAGSGEEDNEELRRWGEPPQFAFAPRDHVDLAAPSGAMGFEQAARITSARFVTLRGPIARLHRALLQFMLDLHSGEHGYQEVYVPCIVNRESLLGTGQLPRFEEDLFKLANGRDLYLAPTAEVPVTNLLRDSIVPAAQLPLSFVCHSPCFRSEAGSYGKDTRGMIRQHQFEKVELVKLVRPQDSWQALEELTGHAERVLQQLELPYRVVSLCGGELGFAAAKTCDIEVWLPGQQRYREISSCSNCLDFQARRLHARWRNPETGKPELLHTINGSGLAVGRSLVAVLENYQQADGSVRVPQVLQPYLNGARQIEFGPGA